MKENNEIIKVYTSFNKIDEEVGTIYLENERGKEIYSFEYSHVFLEKYPSFFLDKDLENTNGRQYLYESEKPIFNFLLDATCDRWGRKLIKKYQEECSNKNNERIREIDYLLCINDEGRMGDYRFKKEGDEDFIKGNEKFNSLSLPSLKDVKALTSFSLDYEKALYNSYQNCSSIDAKKKEVFINAASIMGGARPKLLLKDEKEDLYIAKLPSLKDSYDVEGFEKVINDLAFLCGLKTVKDTRLIRFSKEKSIYIIKRFDRKKSERLHYASCLTLLGKRYGEEASYFEIADFIKERCIEKEANLNELYNRILFSYFINNTDDHLRNHGFLLKKEGWSLSPLFDVNINFDTTSHALNLSPKGNKTYSLKEIIDVSSYFEIDRQKALLKSEEIKTIISENFEKLSHKWGCQNKEIRMMEKVIREKIIF